MTKKLLLRLDIEVYKQIVKDAKENNRSINAEINHRLKQKK